MRMFARSLSAAHRRWYSTGDSRVWVPNWHPRPRTHCECVPGSHLGVVDHHLRDRGSFGWSPLRALWVLVLLPVMRALIGSFSGCCALVCGCLVIRLVPPWPSDVCASGSATRVQWRRRTRARESEVGACACSSGRVPCGRLRAGIVSGRRVSVALRGPRVGGR